MPEENDKYVRYSSSNAGQQQSNGKTLNQKQYRDGKDWTNEPRSSEQKQKATDYKL